MRLIVPLAEGFEEIEAIAVIDILRRANIKVDVVGVEDEVVAGRNGIKVLCDKIITDVKPEDYDGIILPGGNPGYKNLENNQQVINIIKSLNSRGKLVAAICASPTILEKIGILEDKKATCYPTMKDKIKNFVNERVVVDKNIITSQGPGTAIEFALEIVRFFNPPLYEQLKKELLVG
ncbi:MAG: DJ-1/PfpI family protein [Candidatus Aenigmarchaeota archaeon]|jgi:4-methyl-5(b-hydroxyethyl)-thiazole monophosphate biosynthesis|nr:DJ-1/PfpI family protein [Candidatus Aenigmarchaeota archaeon]